MSEYVLVQVCRCATPERNIYVMVHMLFLKLDPYFTYIVTYDVIPYHMQ